MAYVPPVITTVSTKNTLSASNVALTILNKTKSRIENERSLWDRIVDFFMSQTNVRNKYSERLSERIIQIVQAILQNSNYISISNCEYHINIPTLLDISLPVGNEGCCSTPQNADALIDELFKLSQPSNFDANFLDTSGRYGSVTSQMVWWDDNNGPTHKEAMVTAVNVADYNRTLGYQDGTYFYYNNKGDSCQTGYFSKVMAYCLQQNLRPIASIFSPTADTEGIPNFIYCKGNNSPSFTCSSSEEFPFLKMELKSFNSREQLSRFVSSFVTLVHNLGIQDKRTTFSIQRENICSEDDVKRDIEVLTNNKALPFHLLTNCAIDNIHGLILDIQVAPESCVSYTCQVSTDSLSSLRSYIDGFDALNPDSIRQPTDYDDNLRINASYAEQLFDFAFEYQHSVLKRMLNERYILTKNLDWASTNIQDLYKDNPVIKKLNTNSIEGNSILLCKVDFLDTNGEKTVTELLAPVTNRMSSVGEGRGQILLNADEFALKQNSMTNNIRLPNDFKKGLDTQLFNTTHRAGFCIG